MRDPVKTVYAVTLFAMMLLAGCFGSGVVDTPEVEAQATGSEVSLAQFTTLEGAVTAAENAITTVQTSLTNHETRIAALETKLAAAEAALQGLNNQATGGTNAAPIVEIEGAGIYGEAGHSDYAAAKGAITTGLLLSLKNDVSQLGSVRVNAVAPGWTLTEKKSEMGLDEGVMERAKATMALKKLAKPTDVARAIVTLSSDKISGHITGQVIEVAGGMEGRLI